MFAGKASLTNIILGCKDFPRANALADFENPKITAVKMLIVQAQGSKEKNIYVVQFTNAWNKLECLPMASLSGLV